MRVLTVVSKFFWGGRKPNPLTGGVFPPLLVYHSIFFSLRFGTGFPVFSFLSIIGAYSGWKPIHAPNQAGGLWLPWGLDVPGGNHSFSPSLIGLACVFSILNFSVTVMKKEKEKIETPVARDDMVSKDTP